jgi:hypothetical protein
MRLRTIPTVKGGSEDRGDSLTFATNSTACLKVGKLIYRAATDQAAFDNFVADPIAALEEAGIDPSQLAQLEINVVRDDTSSVHIVIPVVNEHKGNLDIYLQELGFVTIMGCR